MQASAIPRILLVASEAVPFAKTGGLGDVITPLAAALQRRGADVTLLLPAYRPAWPIEAHGGQLMAGA